MAYNDTILEIARYIIPVDFVIEDGSFLYWLYYHAIAIIFIIFVMIPVVYIIKRIFDLALRINGIE